MNPYTDFNDFVAPLAARGQSVTRYVKEDPAAKPVRISGRYFDPVSGRLDSISNGEYYRHPVETYHYGRADFIYHGQKEGEYSIPVVNLFERGYNKPSQQPQAKSGWLELKIWEPTVLKKESCYTNLPAQY